MQVKDFSQCWHVVHVQKPLAVINSSTITILLLLLLLSFYSISNNHASDKAHWLLPMHKALFRLLKNECVKSHRRICLLFEVLALGKLRRYPGHRMEGKGTFFDFKTIILLFYGMGLC